MNGRDPINNPSLTLLWTTGALLLCAAGFCFCQQPPAPGDDPKELTELARRYEHGIGCPRDIGRALMYYKRAAEANEPGAMVALGDLYRDGVCVDRDMAYALLMFKRAADAGFLPAMVRYADLLPGDQAIGWLQRAAEKGYGPAMTRLGELTDDVEWYRRAVAANDPPAFARLAARETRENALDLLRRGAGMNDPVAMRMLAFRTTPPESADLFRRAAEAGDAEAMEHYAAWCEQQNEPGNARMWYQKAAQAGRPRAQFWMAQRVGKVEEPVRQAAARAGDPEALYQGGEVQKAAEAGHPAALAQIGKVNEAADKGHPASLFEVGRTREAAEKGHPEAMRVYGLSLTDRVDGMRWIRRAAEAGDVVAMRELGTAYRTGKGIAKDPEQGRKWLQAAADKGDADALYRLGDTKSVEKAAEKGHTAAMVQTRKIEPEKAAGAGSPEGKYELARRTKKVKEAYKLYLESANAGFAPAMIAVGDCHMNARGTWRSEIDAVNWYRRAALAGSAEAMDKLKALGKTL